MTEVRRLSLPVRYAYAQPSVEEATAFLRTGRADLALGLLERLPARIEEERRAAVAAALAAAEAAHQVALAEAHARTAELRREVERLRGELARPQHKHPRMLAEALADGRTTPERVAELLRV